TATVTTSAPLASIARRVSAKSLYLPVPTIKRERNRRSPRANESSIAWAIEHPRNRFRPCAGSAAADELHHLDDVAGAETGRRVAVARHDFAVQFDPDTALSHAEHGD